MASKVGITDGETGIFSLTSKKKLFEIPFAYAEFTKTSQKQIIGTKRYKAKVCVHCAQYSLFNRLFLNMILYPNIILTSNKILYPNIILIRYYILILY